MFVGEYAVTSGYGTYGNLTSALAEAAFMTGLERNSDLVQMASYAPLFANVNGIQWLPDLIYYDSSRGVFGTPSYYVQELFSQNRGDVVLPAVVSGTTSLYASSSLLRSNGQIIVKVVNTNSTPLATTFNVTGVNSIASSATVIQLTSGSPTRWKFPGVADECFPGHQFDCQRGNQFLAHAPGQFTFHSPAHRQRHQFLYEPAAAIRFAHQQRPKGRVHGLGDRSPATGSIS